MITNSTARSSSTTDRSTALRHLMMFVLNLVLWVGIDLTALAFITNPPVHGYEFWPPSMVAITLGAVSIIGLLSGRRGRCILVGFWILFSAAGLATFAYGNIANMIVPANLGEVMMVVGLTAAALMWLVDYGQPRGETIGDHA